MMKRSIISAILAAVMLAGCGPQQHVSLGPNPDSDLRLRLLARHPSFYEYQPLDLVLVVENYSTKNKTIPFAGSDCILEAHRPQDDITQGLAFRMRPEFSVTTFGGRESRMLPLTDRGGNAYLTKEGTWRISCECFAAQQGDAIYRPEQELIVHCVRQPVTVPEGTPPEIAAMLEELAGESVPKILRVESMLTRMPYTPAMSKLRQAGPAAVGPLMANLNHYRIAPMVVQVLGDLQASQAVGMLLGMLQKKDVPMDYLILSALAKITGLAEGADYHKFWSNPTIRDSVILSYQKWMGRHEPTSRAGSQ